MGSVFHSVSLQQDQLTGSVPNPSHVLISYSFSRVSDPDLESDQVAISHSFNSVVWLMQSINIIVKTWPSPDLVLECIRGFQVTYNDLYQ